MVLTFKKPSLFVRNFVYSGIQLLGGNSVNFRAYDSDSMYTFSGFSIINLLPKCKISHIFTRSTK